MITRERGDVWRLAVASAASNTGNWAATIALSLTSLVSMSASAARAG